MNSRIGGEIEIAPDLLAAPAGDDQPALPKPYAAWLDTGRAALYLALREILRLGGARKAWVPAYVCEAVVAAFRALDFELHFYSTGSNFSEMRLAPAEPGGGGVFLYVHYFGTKNVAAGEWLRQADYAGKFFVIEDCVQASLNGNVGGVGDYAFTSYRKFLPQPDGALLGAGVPIEGGLQEADEAFVSAKFLGKLLRHQTRQDETYLALFGEAENRIERACTPRRMSWLSAYLMRRTDIGVIARARRRNWHALLDLIRHSRSAERALSPVIESLSEGDVPLGFPVNVHDGRRDPLRRYLAGRRIYCPVHWDLPHLHDESRWREEIELSRSILTLPIDQRLNDAQLEHMAQAIEAFCEGECRDG